MLSVVFILIDHDIRHDSGQNVVLTKRSRVSPQQILTSVLKNI